jgi:FKBP-type peptidyl-prolyl cis-trans isomerase
MNKKYSLLFIIPVLLILSGCSIAPNNTEGLSSSQPNADQAVQGAQNMSQATELKIEDTVVGNGDEAVAGKQVTVHYTGTLTNGTKFDSSLDRGQPFTFTLGAGEVIQGWDEGVAGMKVGGKRKLTIPPDMGYGPMAIGTIPANSTLLFDVELLQVE